MWSRCDIHPPAGRPRGTTVLPGLLAAALGLASTGCQPPAGTDARTASISPQTGPVTADRPELGLGRSNDFDYDPPVPGSYALPVVQAAADGEVLDANGRPQNLAALVKGRITVLSFIYLRCAAPGACPQATGVLRTVHEISAQDPHLARHLRLVTLSFDPEHDTPARMAAYAAALRERGGADWEFITTRDEGSLQPILNAYGQVVDRRANASDPLGPYYHPVRVYLVDRDGRIRNIYSTATLDPRLVLTDVRTLLLEEQAQLTAR